METRRTLAVVDDFRFYANRQSYFNAFEHGGLASLADLLAAADEARFTHVWIVPGTELSRLASRAGELSGWNITAIYQDKERTRYSFLAARPEDGSQDDMIYVGMTEWSRWPWKGAGDTNPKTLLATLTYIENALGLPVAWTPAHMSLEYIRKLNEHRWSWWQPLTYDLEGGPPGLNYTRAAVELHWPARGQALAIPEGATHLVKIDDNSAFAAAMVGLNVGEGNPSWVGGPFAGCHYDGKRPGFWLVQILSAGLIWDGVHLPGFSYLWMTTDLIEQLRRVGYLVEIEAGWYWLKYHQALRSTAESLWQIRNEWRERAAKSPAHTNCYETIRVVIKAIHGKMARPDTAEHFRRRDIWAMTVTRSTALMIYRVQKIHQQYGVWPVAIDVDSITYAVDKPNIFDEMLGTERLGGFKLVSVSHLV